ncbi:spaetzle domain-containing protein 6 [Haematobia irritans]|uniref:spaetzle domain-containing protein 6 n=1 Tax=Haematobia irritans TaxID=7368 RepID=UPI003F506C4E
MDKRLLLKILSFMLISSSVSTQQQPTLQQQPTQQGDYGGEEPPEGYYAFVESPNAIPPKVRPPPYTHVNIDCKNVANAKKVAVSVNNICGDLNKGQIPKNPMKQNVLGEPYPFELIRNHTLKFLSKTLPVLQADDTLPKVTQILRDDPVEQVENNNIDQTGYGVRNKREAVAPKVEGKIESHDFGYFDPAIDEEERAQKEHSEADRKPRKFCDGGGIFCTIYKAFQGDSSSAPSASPLTAERREEIGPIRYEGPPTPCPAKVEYATPVFAKNYQGSWRYVVQIPYEGYFTQTIEVTRCIQARCHYLDGGCLSSPRWVSLLVAEIFYPNAEDTVPQTSTTTQAPSVQDFQAYQQYLQKRAGVATGSDGNAGHNGGNSADFNQHCDGHDEIGCFQVRLYYDWFLIPGSCKCWRPDYFAKYVRRKSVADL